MDNMGNDIKVCFIGGKQAGIIGLLTLLAKKIQILSIIPYSDDLNLVAKQFLIPSFQTVNDLNFKKTLNGSDLLVCVHGREILKNDVLTKPKLGCINVHPCLYRYKGINPIKRLLEDGNRKASVGIHFMTEKIDEGEVILEEFVDIGDASTIYEVYNLLYPYYSIVLSKAIDFIFSQRRNK